MIIGDGIRLRAIERSDLARFVAWLNDPEVREGLAIYQPLSQAQEENWYENTLKQPVQEQPLVIEIESPQGWTAIGNVGLTNLDWQNRSAEVGIFIGDKQYWNQGYGRKAMEILLVHAFSTMNLHRIFLRVFETNPRAIHSYEKAGFQHEGRMRAAHFQNGQYIDVLLMSALQPEWNVRNREQSRE
ncbi:MAG TPA: GNAT family protein [Levilinea sp.]|nr:GNAT family protein [Levilinea sp.]